MTHELKTWPEPFQAILDGRKSFEVRKSDRPFMVGDVLHLREWNPDGSGYTGRETAAAVTYLVPGGAWGLPHDLCVMGLDSRASPGPREAVEALAKEWDHGIPCNEPLTCKNDWHLAALALRRVLALSSPAPCPQGMPGCQCQAPMDPAPAPTTEPWYEADGSVTMLPAEEVTMRRKLAAKVLAAARKAADAATQKVAYDLWVIPDAEFQALATALEAFATNDGDLYPAAPSPGIGDPTTSNDKET